MNIKEDINLIKFKENYTQKDIANILGVSTGYLSDMVRGRFAYTQGFRQKLIEKFPYLNNDDKTENIVSIPPSEQQETHIKVQEEIFQKEISISNVSELYILNKTIDILRENLERKDKQIDGLFEIIKGLENKLK